MHNNILLNIKKKRFWTGVLLVQFFLFFLLSKSTVAVHFFSALFEWKKTIHQFIASQFSFSTGDLLYIVSSILILTLFFKLFFKDKRAKALLQILLFLNIAYFTYQIFWGMLYFQTPLSEQLSKQPVQLSEAKILAERYLKLTIEARTMVRENASGVFTLHNLGLLKKEIIQSQNTLPQSLINKKSTNSNAIKPSTFKEVMSYTGILGYYNPFTSEAQYNSQLPASYIPFTLAHESSHQMGFAREQEANFAGYLIGKNSTNPDLKYSTLLFALKSLLQYIALEDLQFVQNLKSRFSPAMRRDLTAEEKFNDKHEGILDQLFAFSNNLFLKSNQQDGSITYSYFTILFIKYERENK